MTCVETMPTIDRRARTSDGTMTCYDCGEIIPENEGYVQFTNVCTGTLLQRDICLNCIGGRDRDEFSAILGVIAISLACVALLAWALTV